MRVLVLGGGGREHAILWKLLQSPQVTQGYCCPGNGGMVGEKVACVTIDRYSDMADFALQNQIDLTVVGPEQPLCDGIVDLFRGRGLAIFGPDRLAAKLEGSKAFAKEFMRRHGIPTASATTARTLVDAENYIRAHGAPLVVKADGLAAGKGVTVAMTTDEALAAVRYSFGGGFGAAGQTVLLEDYLQGEEASILALVDRDTIVPLASSQDHKRLLDGDQGPNTGGMGAYSPAPIVDDAAWREIHRNVLEPFHRGCRVENLDYRGVIYAGIMLTKTGPQVLEFNVRFGDPETQAVLLRLQSDLADAMMKTVNNRLTEVTLRWSTEASVCIVMASEGYPGNYRKGLHIEGLDRVTSVGATVFHAGTQRVNGDIVTSGGRVLTVGACGESIKAAATKAYDAVSGITWPGAYYRRDIANKVIGK